MKIEQHPDQLDKLRVISPELGVGYSSPPVFVGMAQFVELINSTEAGIEVVTGFGDYTLRKRSGIWSGYRRVGDGMREYSAGRAENITSEVLDNLAVRLYQ